MQLAFYRLGRLEHKRSRHLPLQHLGGEVNRRNAVVVGRLLHDLAEEVLFPAIFHVLQHPLPNRVHKADVGLGIRLPELTDNPINGTRLDTSAAIDAILNEDQVRLVWQNIPHGATRRKVGSRPRHRRINLRELRFGIL